MRNTTWRKHHKWVGLILAFFIVMACISGLVLNHRQAYANVNIDRAWLPSSYHFRDWNNGLLRGAVPLDSCRSLIYGICGVFLMNNGQVEYYSDGMPEGADFRNIRGMAVLPDSSVYAAGQLGLYRLADDRWHAVDIPLSKYERLSDVEALGDTLWVLTRSRVFKSVSPYDSFEEVPMMAPADFDGRVSLFRVVWLIHSGEMFGLPGKILIDAVGIIMIVLSFTGVAIWCMPKYMRRRKSPLLVRLFRLSHISHDKVGRYGIVLLLFVALTGWMLRPPLLIPLVLNDMPGIEGTQISPSQPWHDKLRMMKFDHSTDKWLLSTSDGFFSLDRDMRDTPVKIDEAPPVSVMGVNVLEHMPDGRWLVGSFSGMYTWDKISGEINDWHTGEPAGHKAGPPFGSHPVSGYAELNGTKIVVEYYDGTDLLDQPEVFSCMPMSLWAFALEVHTGRIYGVFGLAPLLWIFIFGALAIWVILSGWRIRRKK